ncbi:MAG: long-chain-fatty-acid--CoA ligase [Chloroflexi bacterium]|nr:long-chain-fatty-acid--CoA ligase [Chloroflexota bacterium]
MLRRTARRLPHKQALLFKERTWTYAELDADCNRIAHGLAAIGVRKGEHVAILSRNSAAFVLLRFALARLGAVLVPINFMLNPSEVAFVLRHAGVRVLCAAPDLAETASLAAAQETPVEQLVCLEDGAEQAARPGWIPFESLYAETISEPAVDLDSRDPAQIMYTSGTESLPKGAMLSHDALLWQYAAVLVEAELTRSDVILHALPLYHCAQLDVLLGPGMYAGTTNIVVDQPRPDLVLPAIQQHQVTLFFAPPTVWISLLRSPVFDQVDLSSLRKVIYGASIMPMEVLRELNERLPNVRFWNLYGQTEIAPLATALQPGDAMRKPGSVGTPTLNVETRVVDAEMHDVAPGEVGEIVHRSPQLLNGYYRDEERTAEAFVGGWFHSGDLAVVDEEGYITVVDRKKDMIKTGAENVATRQVEDVLYMLPTVAEAAVIGLPHPRWVEAVTAVVVPRAGQTVSEDAIVAHCRQHLAGFKVPKAVVLVESLPKNPSGKILKRALRTGLAELYTSGTANPGAG